jgi:hypothetical protein
MTTHVEGGGSGSVFVDAMRLLQKIPVTLSAAPSGGNIAISWLSQVGTSYQVVYKDNITDSAWTPVGGTVAGDGSTKTASFPATATQRFYSVLTL